MIKRHFFLFGAAILVGLMVLAGVLKLVLGGGEEAGGPGGGRGGRAQQVAEAVVADRTFADRIEVLGVARGRRSVDLTSSTTELITRVMFADGQSVRAGQALVELQAREEDASIIQARANLGQARQDYERINGLAERGIAPRVSAQQARTVLETAQATLQAAQARRGDRVIRAPFSGVLGLSTVTAGTLINPGAVIATLDDIGVVRVDFPVPERYLPVLRPGVPIAARSDAYPDQTFGGRIALVDTRVDEATRAVTARAEFPNPGGRLRPGMNLRVSIERGVRQAPSVPESAVQFEGDTAYVFRIARASAASPAAGGARKGGRAQGAGRGSGGGGGQGQGPAFTAERVTVVTGAIEDGQVEILEGLRPGERVVASGLNRIQNGAAIRVGAAPGQGGRGGAPAAAAPARQAPAQGGQRQ